MSRGRFINLAGSSAAVGKNALMGALVERFPNLNLQQLVTYTTRKIRPGEKDGRDYHFVNKKRFAELAKSDFFLEWKPLNREWYGTPKQDIESILASGRNLITHADPQRVGVFKKHFPDLIAVYVDATDDELRERMEGRGESKETIRKRLRLARRERKYKKYFDRVFHNKQDRFDTTLAEIAAYLKSRLE